jgi:tRNA(fMet)-specific endonuclease VapC
VTIIEKTWSVPCLPAQIRADLTALGKIIGPNDMLIAAIARANNATLVTHNVGEFSRIVGIEIEDWEN